MLDKQIVPPPAIAQLEAALAQQKQTVKTLRAQGHLCADAEKQIERMEAELALLKWEP